MTARPSLSHLFFPICFLLIHLFPSLQELNLNISCSDALYQPVVPATTKWAGVGGPHSVPHLDQKQLLCHVTLIPRASLVVEAHLTHLHGPPVGPTLD